MKIRTALMAFALAGASTPALAQTANPVHRNAPDLNRAPYPDENNNRYQAETDREALIDIGYEYAEKNYRRLRNMQPEGDRGQVTNPHNPSSVTNRVLRRFDPGRIGGGVGQVLRDGGFGSGTLIGGMQKSQRHDEMLRPDVVGGMEAAYEYRDALERNDQAAAENWSRIADDHFFKVGRLVELYEQARYEQGQSSTQRALRGQTNRIFRNNRSPLGRFP